MKVRALARRRIPFRQNRQRAFAREHLDLMADMLFYGSAYPASNVFAGLTPVVRSGLPAVWREIIHVS